MADSNVNPGSEDQPKNPPSGSSSVTNDDSKSGSNAGASGPTVKDNPELIKEIRLNGRKEERRKIASILKEHGYETNGKNLEETLRSVLANPESKPKSNEKPEGKSKGKKDEDGEESPELSKFQKLLSDKDSKISSLSTRLQTVAINSAIAESTAGIAFANEEAASDAIAAFKSSHRFELDDDSQKVRALDQNGEPVTLNGYQDATMRDAFKAFVEKRPHFLKGAQRPGQNVADSKGTGKSGDKGLNQSFNDALRKAAGFQ